MGDRGNWHNSLGLMKNIPLDNEAYRNFRNWLRFETQIIWRDLNDASIIPTWNEAICKADCLDTSLKTPGQRAWAAIVQQHPSINLRWRSEEIKYLDLRPPKLFKSEYRG